MLASRLRHISQQLDKLRELDPYGSVLFGATEHQYQLNPPATRADILTFETANEVELPKEYREFILHVGDGGAGPYYGLHPLLPCADDADKSYVSATFFSSSPEFMAVNWTQQWAAYWAEEGIDHCVSCCKHPVKETALNIGSQGCNLATLLVTNGDCAGEIWSHDHEAFCDSGYGFTPEIAKAEFRNCLCSRLFASPKTDWQRITVYGINPFQSGTVDGLSFLDWYEHWLETGLIFCQKLDLSTFSSKPFTSSQ